MKSAATHRRRQQLKRLTLRAVLVTAIWSNLLQVSPAFAQNFALIEYRVSESIGKTDDVNQYAFAFQLRAPSRLRTHHLEFALGSVSSSIEDRPFASFGVVWRLPGERIPFVHERMYVDFGFSPTWLAGSNVNGRNLGGNLHFTSSFSLGTHLDRRRSLDLSFRIQHTSNGGLSGDNPGLDMIGIGLTFHPQ